METIRQTRRRFITTLIALPLALAGIWRFLSPRQVTKPALLRVAVSALPVGGALVYRQQRIALLREGEQVIALSLVCTHLGCTVSVTPEGMVCPCHGSRFDRGGHVLSGPAERPLDRLTVEYSGDELVIRS
jgi:cytochrome b6-f complex iron-sulfur subunit